MTEMLHQLLEASADRCPNHEAVLAADGRLTYVQLDERANDVAWSLLRRGVRVGEPVGLLGEKGVGLVAGLYGILKAGGCYVPLPPDAPDARLAALAGDCGLRTVVTTRDRRWTDVVHATSTGAVVVGVDTTGSMQRPRVAVTAAQPAYVLYTSGSTGLPKGVTVQHRAALSFVRWAARTFGLASDDRIASTAPLQFDLSTFDLFATALVGGTVVLVDRETAMFPATTARKLDDAAITRWYVVPTALVGLASRGNLAQHALPAMRSILFAGEVMPPRHLRSLMSQLPHVRFANLYGPTETNVCAWHPLATAPASDDPIPIGRAITDTRLHVLDADGRPTPRGAVGELWVQGPTLMQGYWGDGRRTSMVLRPLPFNGGGGAVAYRTGDYVYQDAAGNLRFVGRRDAQIKSRGYRIELGEIESVLASHPSVEQCAVVAVPDENVTNRIVAWVVAEGSPRMLRNWCDQRLSGYMVPNEIHLVEALPTTSTGKIDRAALGSRAS